VEAGDLWAVGTPGGKITVGKLSDGLVLVSWQAHAAAVTGLALASDGSFLLSCSYDGSLARWDPRTGRLFGRL
jgi:WD40 repeat protein